MYTQIILGSAFIIIGIGHLLNVNIFLGKKAKAFINSNNLKYYQKGLALPYTLLGVLLITMGIVERMNVLETFIYIALYVVLAVIPLTMVLLNNKKYSGSYFIR